MILWAEQHGVISAQTSLRSSGQLYLVLLRFCFTPRPERKVSWLSSASESGDKLRNVRLNAGLVLCTGWLEEATGESWVSAMVTLGLVR